MKQKINNFFSILQDKRKILLIDPSSFEEKFAITLTKFGFFSVLAVLLLFIGYLSYITISYTSLKRYIPGYPDIENAENLYALDIKNNEDLTVIAEKNERREKWIKNLQNILSDNDSLLIEEAYAFKKTDSNYKKIIFERIPEDDLLRIKVEKEEALLAANKIKGLLEKQNFNLPLRGEITKVQTNDFKGLDLAADSNQVIRSSSKGVAICVDSNKVIIQHANNIVSIYENCTNPMVKIGETVPRGQKIGSVKSNYLHFEVWYMGNSVDLKKILNL